MKHVIRIICLIVLPFLTFAQTAPPLGFSYSGVARDAQNNALANQNIGVQFTILKGSATGTIFYTENHTTTTDGFGVFHLTIGQGAVQSGVFSTIDWSIDTYFLQVGLDVSGGSSFVIMGTTQFLSVPYALHAKTAESFSSGTGGAQGSGKTYIILSGNITDAQAATQIQLETGTNTQFVWIMRTTQLTTVSFPNIDKLAGIRIENNTALQNVIFDDLQNTIGEVNIATNASLQTINFPALTFSADNFVVGTNAVLTSFNAPSLASFSNTLSFTNNAVMASPNLPSLTSGEKINFNNSCTSISLPMLSQIGTFTLSNNQTTSLELPQLTQANTISIASTSLSTLNIPSLVNANYIGLTGINIPNLVLPNITTLPTGLGISSTATMASISLPNLTSAGAISLSGSILTSAAFPALLTITNSISTNSAYNLVSLNLNVLAQLGSPGMTSYTLRINSTKLTALNLPALQYFYGNFEANYNRLTTANVSALLHQFVLMTPTLTGRYIDLADQSPSAPVNFQGFQDKQTLIANGNTVITDI